MEITKLYIPLPGAVSKAAIQYRVREFGVFNATFQVFNNIIFCM
jgi:hypothetical protein